MSVDPQVLDAKNEVQVRRAALMSSLKHAMGEAKRRLAPDLVAAQAWQAAKRKGSDLAHDAVLEAKARPALYGSIAAGIGAFLLRKPIGRMAEAAYHKVRDDEDGDDAALAAAETPGHKPPPRRVRREAPDAAPTVAEFREPTRPIDEKSPPDEKAASPQKKKKSPAKRKARTTKTEEVK